MAWCPECGSEYVEGIKVCADCGCELVESLTEEDAKNTVSTEEMAVIMAAAMQKVTLGDDSYMESGEMEAATDEKSTGDPFFDEEGPQEKYRPYYVNNEERAEENRTSAYTLLSVGSVGLIGVSLVFLEVIDLGMSITNKYMITGVMGVLFILFIVMGIVSMKNSKILRKKARKENNLTMEIKKWCLQNLNGSGIDSALELSEVQEELKYFQRFAHVKAAIRRQFMNLDEGYLDRLIEEVYPEIFEQDPEQEEAEPGGDFREGTSQQTVESQIYREKAG